MPPDDRLVKELLQEWSRGDSDALRQLIPLVYDDLRSLARQRIAHARSDNSLNTTGLVHEAYLRFARVASLSVENRNHLLALASRVMRDVLVEHVRARTATKRGGGAVISELHEESWVADVELDKVSALHEALTRLEELDARQARMIEQRYFGGMSLDEIAQVAGVSLATVKRELRSARAWLAVELDDGDTT